MMTQIKDIPANANERNPHATERLAKLLNQYPGLDFEPLLEHVTAFESPEAFEDLFNHLILTLSAHLKHDEFEGRYLGRLIGEVSQFRDALRKMRGAGSWA